ncbi:MAG TPA: trypsin-like peptidase domain-containing protein [Planctomycetota bacterium]|jgi:S1-C subfamily serine protease
MAEGDTTPTQGTPEDPAAQPPQQASLPQRRPVPPQPIPIAQIQPIPIPQARPIPVPQAQPIPIPQAQPIPVPPQKFVAQPYPQQQQYAQPQPQYVPQQQYPPQQQYAQPQQFVPQQQYPPQQQFVPQPQYPPQQQYAPQPQYPPQQQYAPPQQVQQPAHPQQRLPHPQRQKPGAPGTRKVMPVGPQRGKVVTGRPAPAAMPQQVPQQGYLQPGQPPVAVPIPQPYPQQAYPPAAPQPYPQQNYPQATVQQPYPQQPYPQQAVPQQPYPQQAAPYPPQAAPVPIPIPVPGQVPPQQAPRTARAPLAGKRRTAAASGVAKEPEDDAAAKQRKLIMIVGGAIAASILILALVLIGRGSGAKTDTAQKPSDDDKKAPVVTKPGTETKAVADTKKDVEPAEPAARKKWLLKKFDEQSAATPTAFAELLEKLDSLQKLDENDAELAGACDQRVRQVKARAEKRADEVAESLGASAMKKADGGDYKSALAELDKFPVELSRTEASQRVFFYRRKLSEKAMELYQAADRKAQQLCDAADYAGADKAYASVGGFGHPKIDKLVAMRRAEMKDFGARGKNPSEGRTLDLSEQQAFIRADIYACMPDMAANFDTAFHEAVLGTREVAESKINLGQYPRSPVFYYCRGVMLSRVGEMDDARWCAEQAARLALPNEQFKSRLLALESRIALFGSGDFQTGVGKAQEALQLDPKNADGVFLLGIANSFMGEHVSNANSREQYAQRGNDFLKMAVQLDPQYARLVPKEIAGDAGGDGDKYKFTGAANPYLSSVVLVHGRTALGEGEGTGWAVHSTPKVAYIITNNHVIKGLSDFTVTYQQESFGNLVRKMSTVVKILGTDPVNDLALLEVGTETQVKALPVRATTSGLVLPMKLTMIGHPKGLDFTVITGELANLSRMSEGKRHLQINSNVDCGMSGGPVIDDTGHVVGVTVAKIIGMGQSLAIITEHVRDLCAKSNITVELKTGK